MKVVTKSGFECEANEKIRNDWRFVKAMSKAESRNELERLDGLMKMVQLLLGDQEEALCNHVKEEDGTVPFDAMNRELIDILQAMGEELKNQSPSPA